MGDAPVNGVALIGAALLGVVGLHLAIEHLPAIQAATDPLTSSHG